MPGPVFFYRGRAPVYIRHMTEIQEDNPEQPAAPVVPEPGPEDTSPEAPYGWMTDPSTGLRRPRKRAGRRPAGATPPAGKSPALEDLKDLGALPAVAEDVAPGASKRRAGKGRKARAPKAVAPLPPFREGVIAKGMNKLYKRAGRLIRIWDPAIGSAVIASTMPTDDDDVTVGEAWENLAKTNPRIRALLLSMMKGGAYTDLFTAHLPILLAVMMRDGIREKIKFLPIAEAFLVDDDETEEPSDLSRMMGGINPADMAQMMQMAQGLMGNVAADMSRGPGVPYRGPSDTHAPYEADPGTGGA